jgi:hypothetical protein
VIYFYVFFGVTILLMCLVLLSFYLREKRRRRGLQAEANRLGLRYSYYDPFGIPAAYGHLNHFSEGINRYAFNVVRGRYEEYSVLAFDYSYAVDTPKRRRNQPPPSYILSLLILMLEARLPRLIVHPRAMADKFPAIPADFQDVPIDSAAFSAAYLVKSTHTDFARDFFHPAMVTYFVEHPALSVEVHGNTLLVHLAEIMDPEELESQVRRLVEIRRLFPEHLFEVRQEAELPEPL